MKTPPEINTVISWVVVQRSDGFVSATPDDGRLRVYATRMDAVRARRKLREPAKFAVRRFLLNGVHR